MIQFSALRGGVYQPAGVNPHATPAHRRLVFLHDRDNILEAAIRYQA